MVSKIWDLLHVFNRDKKIGKKIVKATIVSEIIVITTDPSGDTSKKSSNI